MKEKLRKLIAENDNSAAKAAGYYLLCQLLVNGMAFITTPIFSRMMGKAEYGMVSNFLAWEATLFPFLTLNLRTSINKSKYDFSTENDSFLFSIFASSQFITIVAYIIAECNSGFFTNLLNMNMKYVRMLFIYIFFYTAFDFQQIQYNIYRRYKIYVIYSIASSFCSLLLSVILVFLLDNKFEGRIMGIIIPVIIIGFIISFNIWRRGKGFNIKYVKYALAMTIPLLPSALSATILSSSDRIIITKYCGSSETAMYAVAYSIASIASILWMALNQAWGPWFFDNLNDKNYERIKSISNKFSTFYVVVIIGLMLIAPEILLLMGGNSYLSAVNAMPPVILAMVCQFFYAFYFNIEYFYGETYIISVGTLMAAILNIVLNIIFVPKYGYVAAAYTTLAGYTFTVLYHYLVVKVKLKRAYIFDNKYFAILILILCVLQIGIFQLYELIWLRYICVFIYFIGIAILALKNKNYISMLTKKLLK